MRVLQEGRTLEGVTCGLDASGFLLLREDSGAETTILAGGVRPAYGTSFHMLLALDVGNTNITIGTFEGTVLRGRWRLRTIKEQTADEWGILLRNSCFTRCRRWSCRRWMASSFQALCRR